MKKVYMSYEEFKKVCLEIADRFKDQGFDEIIAVSRGGISAAHIIAKAMKLPVGYYIPKIGIMVFNENETKKILVIEDLVAEGRTYEKLKKDMPRDIDYTFCPILLDANYNNYDNFPYGFISSDWIVFPYEDFDRMQVGDRGLFRENTDSY